MAKIYQGKSLVVGDVTKDYVDTNLVNKNTIPKIPSSLTLGISGTTLTVNPGDTIGVNNSNLSLTTAISNNIQSVESAITDGLILGSSIEFVDYMAMDTFNSGTYFTDLGRLCSGIPHNVTDYTSSITSPHTFALDSYNDGQSSAALAMLYNQKVQPGTYRVSTTKEYYQTATAISAKVRTFNKVSETTENNITTYSVTCTDYLSFTNRTKINNRWYGTFILGAECDGISIHSGSTQAGALRIEKGVTNYQYNVYLCLNTDDTYVVRLTNDISTLTAFKDYALIGNVNLLGTYKAYPTKQLSESFLQGELKPQVTPADLDTKQNKLTAGSNVTIVNDIIDVDTSTLATKAEVQAKADATTVQESLASKTDITKTTNIPVGLEHSINSGIFTVQPGYVNSNIGQLTLDEPLNSLDISTVEKGVTNNSILGDVLTYTTLTIDGVNGKYLYFGGTATDQYNSLVEDNKGSWLFSETSQGKNTTTWPYYGYYFNEPLPAGNYKLNISTGGYSDGSQGRIQFATGTIGNLTPIYTSSNIAAGDNQELTITLTESCNCFWFVTNNYSDRWAPYGVILRQQIAATQFKTYLCLKSDNSKELKVTNEESSLSTYTDYAHIGQVIYKETLDNPTVYPTKDLANSYLDNSIAFKTDITVAQEDITSLQDSISTIQNNIIDPIPYGSLLKTEHTKIIIDGTSVTIPVGTQFNNWTTTQAHTANITSNSKEELVVVYNKNGTEGIAVIGMDQIVPYNITLQTYPYFQVRGGLVYIVESAENSSPAYLNDIGLVAYNQVIVTNGVVESSRLIPISFVYSVEYGINVYDLCINSVAKNVADNTTALNGIKLKVLTQAEYDAITTKDPTTLYLING